ncbi:MAG: alpha-amylase/4-alpha-glucanotransferase domain-containing protein [Nitrospirota bacterium]
MNKISFILIIHNHQPVGNFDSVFEKSYKMSYLPFLNMVKRHPSINITLHYSGVLLEWLSQRHPEFIELIMELCDSGQVEMMSGGFYEPILTILPDRDKIGQIQKLSGFIRDRFKVEPQGLWLAERVWEPYLTKPITEAGIRYISLDDYHFKMAGLREEQLSGYYLTEEQGNILSVLPGNELLRYLIPFHPPEETIDYLKKVCTESSGGYISMADDGEKFGIWPGTYKLVYEDGWLERFFSLLEKNSDWIRTVKPSDYLEMEQPLGRIYFPISSYREMCEWSLSTPMIKSYENIVDRTGDIEDIRHFLRSGIWRNFLIKYPEVRNMYQKMLYVSRIVNERVEKLRLGSKKKKDMMLNELWQGECNDAYWHGVFGGLYLPHLRYAIYQHLIKAEEIARIDKRGRHYIEVEEVDIDNDRAMEIAINTDIAGIYIDLEEGGRIYEFDYKPKYINLLDTLARREEAYHKRIRQIHKENDNDSSVKTIHEGFKAKEEGLEGHLYYDWYQRDSLIDHFIGSNVDLKSFKNCNYKESGDFVNGKYYNKIIKKKKEIEVILTRDGLVEGKPVSIAKSLFIKEGIGGFKAGYILTNKGNEIIDCRFGVEFNISLLAGNAHDRYYNIPGNRLKAKNLASSGEKRSIKRIELIDEWLGIRVSIIIEKETTIWRFPVETISLSEDGFEKIYQSSVVFPHWHITLSPHSEWKMGIDFIVEGI